MKRPPVRTQWAPHLADWMKHRGLTKAQLARRSGVSEAFVGQIVNGKASGSPEVIEKIAAALDIDPGTLADMLPPPPGYRLLECWVPEGRYHRAIWLLDMAFDALRVKYVMDRRPWRHRTDLEPVWLLFPRKREKS